MKLGLLSILSIAMSAATSAQTGTIDERSFTVEMMVLAKQTYPDAKVSSPKPLEIRVRDKRRSIDSLMMLDRVYVLCANQNQHCQSERERVVTLLTQASDTESAKASKSTANLRVLVRSAEAFRLTADSMKMKESDVITRQIADDLLLVLAIDLPETIVWASKKAFPGDQNRRDELMAIALSNTVRELSVDVASRTMPLGKFSLTAGNPYDSSCFADQKRWDDLVAVAKGRLLVAIPGADACLFGDATSADDVAEFRQMTRNIVMRAQRAVSDQVYERTSNGWKRVP